MYHDRLQYTLHFIFFRASLCDEREVVLCAQLLTRVQLFKTAWTVAHQAPLSVGILQARILE